MYIKLISFVKISSHPLHGLSCIMNTFRLSIMMHPAVVCVDWTNSLRGAGRLCYLAEFNTFCQKIPGRLTVSGLQMSAFSSALLTGPVRAKCGHFVQDWSWEIVFITHTRWKTNTVFSRCSYF